MEEAKEIFDYFVKYQEQARAHRLYNAFSGKTRSKQMFTRFLWMYIVTHEEEARPVIRDLLGERGIVLTDVIWKSYQYNKAKLLFRGVTGRRKFLHSVGIEENFVPVETPSL